MRRAYAWLLLALSGCNPTSGFADSADAALPSVKRYFDGAGSQLIDGPWSRVVVDLDSDTLYHVGARRLDDKQPTFHLFGADARDGCAVTPNAGTWLMGKSNAAPFRVLPFLEDIDERGRGRLRFTTLDCQVQELAVADAGRPYPRLYDHGYLVPTKRGYTFADPWSGETREIAADVTRVLVWNNVVLLWADGQLKSFTDQFEVGDTWGSKLQAVVPINDSFLVEDADGLHHVTLDRTSMALSSEDVLSGACHLQHSSIVSYGQDSARVVLEQPCGDPQPSIVHMDTTTFEVLDSFQLPFEADATHARALVAGTDANGEQLPLSALYLTDVDADDLGTAWAWQAGAGAPIKLGEHAELDSVFLEPPESPWSGSVQINYQPLGDLIAHDWVHFRWDGTVEPIAERIVRNTSSGEVLVNFDGMAGDLPQFSGDGYRVLAKGVSPYAGEATSYAGERHHARVDHFDGNAGRVLLGTDAKDPSSWDVVGNGAPPESLRFAWFMPALMFIEDWDPDSNTGSLVAYNYELDARDTIAEGVSSFDLTSYPWDGVLYSVPRGKKRGIWFSKAK
jgi:hypothetical protein